MDDGNRLLLHRCHHRGGELATRQQQFPLRPDVGWRTWSQPVSRLPGNATCGGESSESTAGARYLVMRVSSWPLSAPSGQRAGPEFGAPSACSVFLCDEINCPAGRFPV